MAKIVVFGHGQMAELADFYLTHDSIHEIVAFTVDEQYLPGERYLGRPIVPFERVEELYPPDDFDMFVAVGYTGLNELRAKKYHEAKKKGYSLISYISSKTSYWGSEIGDNCFIFENNAIMAFCKIGNNVMSWIGSILAHHATIGDHTTITSHVAIGGNVTIEPYCFFGLNSTVRNDLIIREGCIIATGANVVKDTEPYGVYMGNPAQLHKKRSKEVNL